jgi:arylsulfatase A-like enzyme
MQPAQPVAQSRVIWIVLDELGYRQVYEHRPRGLDLPTFDRLRAESTVFSDVRPAGMYTELVLPSLMTGQAVDRIRSSADGLRLQMHDEQGWQTFHQQDTVFADANALGYRSAVVGWYIPYCRLLPAVLSSCVWTSPSELANMFPSHRMGPNLVHPFLRLLHKVSFSLSPRRGPLPDELDDGNLHIQAFQKLDRASDAALADPRNTFLLLHMPIPHPKGIWDRHRKQFAVDRSSYVDNLALADAYLGHICQLLAASGQWDNATLLVMGDHAWRTRQLWRKTSAWSAEDEAASDGGQFDDRPGYLLKLPHQHTPAQLTTAFPALRTRALLYQLLSSRFTRPEQLQQWVQQVPQDSGQHRP